MSWTAGGPSPAGMPLSASQPPSRATSSTPGTPPSAISLTPVHVPATAPPPGDLPSTIPEHARPGQPGARPAGSGHLLAGGQAGQQPAGPGDLVAAGAAVAEHQSVHGDGPGEVA